MRKLMTAVAATAITLAIGGEAGSVTISGQGGRPDSQTQSSVRVDQWPKSVDEFLAGNYLERADVVLTRREWDPASYVIRWVTDSPFSHSAMIFTSPVHEQGFASTFVIEAGTDGVDLTNFRDYVDDKSSAVAIKRLKRDWFSADKQSRVRGLLLENIKADYNYSHFRPKSFKFKNARAGTGKDYRTSTQVGTEMVDPGYATDPDMSWLCDIDPAICEPYESPIYEYTDHAGSSGVINGRNASNSLNNHSVKVGLTYRF